MAQSQKLAQNSRQHILRVARRLFSHHGYEGTSTEKVLEEAQVSRGSLYYHFENKQAIFAAVLELVEEELTAAAAQAAQSATNPVDGLRAAFASFLYKASEPEVRQIVLTDAQSVVGWQKWREIEERYGLGLLKAGLLAIADAGGIERGMVDMYAHMLLATGIEIAFLISRASDPTGELERGQTAINTLLNRLLTRSSPPS